MSWFWKTVRGLLTILTLDVKLLKKNKELFFIWQNIVPVILPSWDNLESSRTFLYFCFKRFKFRCHQQLIWSFFLYIWFLKSPSDLLLNRVVQHNFNCWLFILGTRLLTPRAFTVNVGNNGTAGLFSVKSGQKFSLEMDPQFEATCYEKQIKVWG